MIWQELIGRTQSALRGLIGVSNSSLQQASGHSILDLTELEDRILMSATPLAVDGMSDADLDEPVEVDGASADTAHLPLVSDGTDLDHYVDTDYVDTDHPLSETDTLVEWTDQDVQQHQRHELAFVDTSIDGYQELLDQIIDGREDATQLDLIELDGSSDGVEQISHVLDQYEQLDAVHIVSHGTDGSVRLGNVWLDADHMNAYAKDIANWSDALASDADLMLYACDLASTPDGQAFLQSLSALTGADVAASIDVTGHESLGGDWDLEFSTGLIESAQILSPDSQQLWVHILPVEFFYDGFESHTYTGSLGSVNWTDGWHEIGEADGEDAGAVRIAHYDLDMIGSHCLEINAVAGHGLYREADLSSASSAFLHFDYQRHDATGFLGSTLEVQVSSNGGSSWVTIHTIDQGLDAFPKGAVVRLVFPHGGRYANPFRVHCNGDRFHLPRSH